jgi:hypothetical protein
MRRFRIGRVDEERAHSLLVTQGVRNLGLPGEDRGIGIGGISAPLPSLCKTPNHGGMIGLTGEYGKGRCLPLGQLLK